MADRRASYGDVATLRGESIRSVRGQIAHGEIPAVKRDGRWVVDRGRLPLTDAQRRTLQTKADSVREAVEAALPSRMARTVAQRAKSMVDLDAFRLGAELLFEIRRDEPGLPGALRLEAASLLEEALLALAEAVQLFDRASKLAAITRARAGLARTTATLLLRGGLPPPDPVHAWVVRLETEVAPAVAGFARWTEKLGR